MRAGTENVAGIAGLGAAAAMAAKSLDQTHERLESLRDELATLLKAGIGWGGMPIPMDGMPIVLRPL